MMSLAYLLCCVGTGGKTTFETAYTTKRGDKYDGEYRHACFYDRGESEFF